MQPFALANIHQRFLQVLQIVFGKVVLVSSLAVDWPFGVGLRLYIEFAQAVDYDVGMDVACSVIAICMGADQMLSVCFVEDLDYQVEEKIQKIKTTLTSVIERYVAGEEIRIWYSYNPDELCGMYWLMKQLQPLNCQTTIYLVKLPTWEYGKENTMTSKIAWGEVSPGEWGNYITLQEKANPVFLSACAMKWNQLQNENAPLRAMLNGKLQSVSEDIYDSFILREIAEQPEQFKMAIVIGNVLGKYQLGISDVWISNRIDKMLEDGVLEIIQDAPKGETNYRRILRKRMK